jgi:dinuclear metal center YbgI/SA1388 family protein
VALTNIELTNYLNTLLKSNEISDYCPNGLQVEGATSVSKIVTGVTASQALIDCAIDEGADTLIVHHGYFWNGENQTISGMKKNRIKALLQHDINLYAYHLPLDVHCIYGNNQQLGRLLEIDDICAVEQVKPQGVLMQGRLTHSISALELQSRLKVALERDVLMESPSDKLISRIAWCTGGGQGFIEQAVEAGVDAFITGEVSEQTIHTAREMGISFYAAGHHATERYGVKSLGNHLADTFDVDVTFIDIPNPA